VLLAVRVWAVVLSANLAATWVFAAMAAIPGVFPTATMQAMTEIAAHTMAGPFWHTVLTGGSAGWLIGLMVWLLPSAHASRTPIIIILTYVIAICQFPHIIAGSVEAAFRVVTADATFGDYVVRFLVPTFLGNAVGGTILAALLNHAPLAGELTDPDA
jgi:formate/nitrite transporter FocA (FNT family)